MKSSLVAMMIFLVAGGACAQSIDDITTIAFTKQSRGFLDEVVVSRDTVHGIVENHRIAGNSQHYASSIDKDQWARVILTLSDVPLEHIDGLQSPTMNRAHDGAMHSSIEITFKDGTTISHSFDDENPHPDLQPLLDALLQYRVPAGK